MKTISQSRIFISYSHRGTRPAWKATLLRALHVFERHHLPNVWQDGRIRISSYWDDNIQQAMASAQLAVVLLTKEALEPRTAPDSNYILEPGFPFLCERQHRDKLPVFPVICEACDWKPHNWLRAIQAPNTPTLSCNSRMWRRTAVTASLPLKSPNNSAVSLSPRFFIPCRSKGKALS